MARGTDQKILALEPLQQADGLLWRQALLAEMDAAGVGGERDVQTVVYYDPRAGRFGLGRSGDTRRDARGRLVTSGVVSGSICSKLHGFTREHARFLSGEILFADLDPIDACRRSRCRS